MRAFSIHAAGAAVALATMAMLVRQVPAHAQEALRVLPAPAFDETATTNGGLETAVVSGGCFWGVQGVFEHVKGVSRAVSGYAGGSATTAHYEMVSGGDTGHAESVQITYDPKQISYGQLLQIFFSVAHDPTQLNHQGPDYGSQYRSALFPANAMQQRIADRYIAQLNKAGLFHSSIVTRTDALKGFYPAEDYHQDFLALNPTNSYIAINDLPKLRNLQRLFPNQYRDEPALVVSR